MQGKFKYGPSKIHLHICQNSRSIKYDFDLLRYFSFLISEETSKYILHTECLASKCLNFNLTNQIQNLSASQEGRRRKNEYQLPMMHVGIYQNSYFLRLN